MSPAVFEPADQRLRQRRHWERLFRVLLLNTVIHLHKQSNQTGGWTDVTQPVPALMVDSRIKFFEIK